MSSPRVSVVLVQKYDRVSYMCRRFITPDAPRERQITVHYYYHDTPIVTDGPLITV